MDKELIDHIKDSLSAHEEAYTPGAWERFSVQEEKKRRRFVLWPLWSAAAVLMVFGGLFFLNNNSEKIDQIAIKKPLLKKELGIDTITTTSIDPETQNNLSANVQKSNKNLDVAEKLKNKTVSLPTAVNPKADVYGQSNLLANPESNINTDLATIIKQNENPLLKPNTSFNIANNDNKKAALIIEQKKPAQSRLTFEDILARDSYANNQLKNNKSKSAANSKWEPGIYVAPAIGNDNKVNMNYGFSLSYNVADKLSVSSGIAYTALSSTSNPSNGGNNNMSFDAVSSPVLSAKGSSTLNTSKSLESVNANVNGINIPLELKYSISKKFYTGVGVSALAILNNRQDKNYLVSSAQNTTVANSIGGYAEQKMLLVTERISEPQAEATTAAGKYIGFYNFSIGYKQKISGKKNFAVEPFLRLPMKTFSNDNLNLTNGGVRLKLDF
ncbi:hypothetical protein [Pedobacter sp. Leaf170]|uniref:hypothetical protein n=1 Tax=Pedobacter sp. Leaf170 TaxID=2876558 RepID=UPI001E5D0D65|nr:hypothetical protein [Pedobacter sp. Leaf170]